MFRNKYTYITIDYMYILWFDQIKGADHAKVGGKNASLGEMTTMLKNKNIRVPFGFAIQVNAFDDFLKFNNVDFDGVSNLSEYAKELRNEIVNGVFPLDMESEILNAFDSLDCEVAVRSSSTAEDMPDASFAGQQDTFLNVCREQLLDKIKQCFASLYNDRSISYRSRMGYSDASLSVAIQKMVRSDKGSAGVAFSLDTETGFDKVIIINGSYGLGELVVGGIINPDEFIVFKETLTIIDKKLGSKKQKMIYDTIGTTIISTGE